MKILIATTNPGKIREFRHLLGELPGLEFSDLTELPKMPEVQETGQTFLANACLKASAYARAAKIWSLADDSGLAVDALGKKPGVFSARWAKMHDAGAGDAANNALLLKQLNGLPPEKRNARFICALALADPLGRVILTASDEVEGRILTQPRGSGGFGYDPLFLLDSLGKTTAELPPEEKHLISHRGKALRRLANLLQNLGDLH